MKRKKIWNYPKLFFVFFFLCMIVLYLQFAYLSLSEKVYGINIKKFALNRNTVTDILSAKRGTIYDVEGNVLATDVSSYTLIAYLDSKRETDYVEDKEYTAHKLSTILGEENEQYILERLNSSAKQVEFGSVGKNITELTRLAIKDLNLDGIDFIESTKRYYPNGNFASYIVGYAKQYTRINLKVNEEYDLYSYYKNFFDNYQNVYLSIKDKKVLKSNGTMIRGLKNGTSMLYIMSGDLNLASIEVNVNDYEIYNVIDSTVIGELGIESKFNKQLIGVDGYTKYEQDKYGYKIPETPEETKEAINGYDIYLTIDSNIQRFAESSISELNEKYEPDYALISVMDAKTGDILASATTPSFNPNNLTSDMNYQNPLLSYTYEPGSVMKIYTYMCALETGNYDGSKTFKSGSYEFDDGTIISDWNKTGWGVISYDAGFSYSSNTGIINIIKDYLSRENLRTCLEKYGFGSTTGIELSHELKGNIEFRYETEIMSAGFGQGIATTAIQQLQGLSIIANEGHMVKPHIISKIVDANTNEEKITNVKKSERIVSSSTISKIKDLMESVISEPSATGKNYYMDEYNIIGKTGTAQISEHGKYLTGENDYLVSVALMYPKDNPEIIIYALAKRPKENINYALVDPVKQLIKNISKYRIMTSTSESENDTKTKLNTYVGKNIEDATNELSSSNLNIITIGDGDKIIKQYPIKDKSVIKGDKIYLVTNFNTLSLIDLNNWSKSDAGRYCELLGITCNFSGYGYVVSQSIESGTIIDKNTVLDIELGNIK